MEILMLGWEYPPVISGGLGIASQGLAESLAREHTVDFLLPKLHKNHHSKDVNLLQAEKAYQPSFWKKKSIKYENLHFLEIGVELIPYLPPVTFEKIRTETKERIELTATEESQLIESINLTGDYNEGLSAEVKKYALIAMQIATEKKYQLVHCHDWMSFPAGMAIRKSCNLPMIAHIHSTEFDRNPDYPDHGIVSIEKNGLEEADLVFVVSDYIKKKIRLHYNIQPDKIKVIPNGFDPKAKVPPIKKTKNVQIIGFAGRFVHQKNPLRFIDIAREISNKNPKARFIMAGDGYMMKDIRQKIQKFNLTEKFTLPGFVENREMLKYMSIMDVFIMPSFSEPYGLVALEALQMKTPVISSTNAGIIEFIPSIPAFDQWDVFSYVEMTLKILDDPIRKMELLSNSEDELKKLDWSSISGEVVKFYKSII